MNAIAKALYAFKGIAKPKQNEVYTLSTAMGNMNACGFDGNVENMLGNSSQPPSLPSIYRPNQLRLHLVIVIYGYDGGAYASKGLPMASLGRSNAIRKSIIDERCFPIAGPLCRDGIHSRVTTPYIDLSRSMKELWDAAMSKNTNRPISPVQCIDVSVLCTTS